MMEAVLKGEISGGQVEGHRKSIARWEHVCGPLTCWMAGRSCGRGRSAGVWTVQYQHTEMDLLLREDVHETSPA